LVVNHSNIEDTNLTMDLVDLKNRNTSLSAHGNN